MFAQMVNERKTHTYTVDMILIITARVLVRSGSIGFNHSTRRGNATGPLVDIVRRKAIVNGRDKPIPFGGMCAFFQSPKERPCVT